MNTTELIGEINTGKHDGMIDHLAHAIVMRKKQLGESKMLSIQPGQFVWFNVNTNPSYLRGVKAVVKKVNRKRIVVNLETPIGRFGTGNINVPVALLSTVKQ